MCVNFNLHAVMLFYQLVQYLHRTRPHFASTEKRLIKEVCLLDRVIRVEKLSSYLYVWLAESYKFKYF